MFLWKFTRGYVKIRMRCMRPEKMVNLLLAEGISLHNIERENKSTITAVTETGNCMPLVELTELHGGEACVLEQRGLPVLLRSLKSRFMLIAVLIIGFAAMCILSHRVLLIDISGCDALEPSEILSVVADCGVRIGMPSAKLNAERVADSLLNALPTLSFADAGICGVVLKINVSEYNSAASTEENTEPCGIYADKDCVILSIVANKGNAAVRKGAAVRQGQLLIDGDITPEGSSERVLVHSRGTITGQVAYRFSVEIGKTAPKLCKSGNSCEYTQISFPTLFKGKKITRESRVLYDEFEVTLESCETLDAGLLPVRVYKGRAHELVVAEKNLTYDEMTAAANAKLDAEMKSSIPKDARIIAKSTDFIQQADGTLIAVLNVQTIENIGYIQYY